MKTDSNCHHRGWISRFRAHCACVVPTLALFLALATTAGAQIYVANFGTPDSILQFTTGGVGSTLLSGSPLADPQGLTLDSAGNVYVASGTVIIKVTPDGTPSTFASTYLSNPFGLVFDGAGNLYAANYSGAYQGTIIRFNSSGGGATQFATGLGYANGLAIDASGNLYVTRTDESAANPKIVKITPEGTKTDFITSNLSDPKGLAFDLAGNLYVANAGNDTIWRFDSSGGSATQFADPSGLRAPYGIAFDGAGHLYVSNFGDNTIEKYALDGTHLTFVNADLSNPIGIAAVPEPSACALAEGLAGLALAFCLRRRHSAGE